MHQGSSREYREDRKERGGRGRSSESHGSDSRSPERRRSDDRWGQQFHRRTSCSSDRDRGHDRRSPQRRRPQGDIHTSRARTANYSPERSLDRHLRVKRSRSHSRDGKSSRSSRSPPPKKRKKEKRKKHKRKKHHKGERSTHKKKREHRSPSPSTSSADDGVAESTLATASPSKHRSRVTVVESPRVDAPNQSIPNGSSSSSSSTLAPPSRSHAAKLMAVAEQKRRKEGPNAGRIMSEAERRAKQRAATQAEQRRGPATTVVSKHEQETIKSAKSDTEPNTHMGDARSTVNSHKFGGLLPRSMSRPSVSNKKVKSRPTDRMSDRPAFPLKIKPSSSEDVPERPQRPASPALSTGRPAQEATAVAAEPQVEKPAPPAQTGHCASAGYVTCCECEDQPADVHCVQCDEPFCRPCWGGQHRRGKRSLHKLQPILGELLERSEQPAEPSRQQDGTLENESSHSGTACEHTGIRAQTLGAAGCIGPTLPPGGMAALYSNDSERRLKLNRERVKWLPLRLTDEERSILSLLQGALHHSDYTDKVDVFSHSDKVDRQLRAMQDYMQTQCGLRLANSFKAGQRLVKSKIRVNQDFFARAFEVGRRYKVMNPEKMRSDYGKMMYLLMDSQRPEVAKTLQINLVKPIQTVGQLLHAKHGEGILASVDLDDATRDLSDDIHDKSQLRDLQQQKHEAAGRILEKYSSKDLSRDEITRVLDSISDANNFLANNEKPVTRMLELLKTNFDLKGPKGNIKGGHFSLAIGRGNNFRSGGSGHMLYGGHKRFTVQSMGGSNSGGAKLSHSHSTQFTFTSQTFMLWQQVSKHMYKLWIKADHDMLHNPYRLQNTGQGLNRVQQCPQVSKEMHRILHSVQQRCGGHWVGLSVIHLGDRDVPNALTFIDKYTQVPHILAPIISCVEHLDSLSTAENTARYIQLSGGAPRLKMQILSDFFKHGFDGSGDDGGSCIDGRLTSSWNWCSKIEKKPYYNVFLLAGFRSFN